MRLRIKFKGNRITTDIEENASLNDLRIAVFKSLFLNRSNAGKSGTGSEISSRISLSLNGTDELVDGEVSLQSLGIVHGDLLHVINNDESHLPQVSIDSATSEPSIKDVKIISTSKNIPSSTCSSKINQDKSNVYIQKNDVELRLQQNIHGHGSTSNSTNIDNSADKMSVDETRDSSTSSVPAPPALFLHEGITPLLEELFSSIELSNSHDAIFIVLHVLISESGFVLQAEGENEKLTGADCQCQDEKLLSTDILQLNWKHPGGLYKLIYFYSTYQQEPISLTCTAIGPYLMVVGSTTGEDSKIFQTKIKVARHVKHTKIQRKAPSEILQNLKELSRVFKDQVVQPIISEVRSKLNLPNLTGSFLTLPFEMLMLLLSKLDVRSLIQMTAVCKQLNSTANEPELWRRLCLRDFELTSDARGREWKKIYVVQFRERKEIERFLQQQPYPIMDAYPRFNEDARPRLVFPGMRGGAHDLFPAAPYMPGSLPFPHPSPLFQPGPSMRPRFDPYGPLPEHDLRRQPRRDRFGPRNSSQFGSDFL